MGVARGSAFASAGSAAQRPHGSGYAGPGTGHQYVTNGTCIK